MTNDELRARLASILPTLLLEIRQRGKLEKFVTVQAAASWAAMADIVRVVAGQVTYRSAAARIEIDEVVQRTILKLQSRTALERLSQSRAPLAYLRGLIRFVVLDDLRGSEGTVPLTGLEEADPAGTPEAPAHQTLAHLPLRRALRALSPSERRLLKMRFWDNLTVAQIADVLGEPYSRVAVRLFRLIQRLKNGLAPP